MLQIYEEVLPAIFGPDFVEQLEAPTVPPIVQVTIPVGATPVTPVTIAVKTRVDPSKPVPLPVKVTPPTGGALAILTVIGELRARDV